MISDDAGTVFTPVGGGTSGSQSFRQSTFEFAAAIPATATKLFVLGPGMADSQKIAVDLI
jgi:hypothetical protein